MIKAIEGKRARKSILLLVSGDGDYGAMYFENNYNVDELYKEMVAEGVTKKTLAYNENDDDDGYCDENLYVKIYEFGEVDPEFVSFITNEFIDYDDAKGKDFYWVTV